MKTAHGARNGRAAQNAAKATPPASTSENSVVETQTLAVEAEDSRTRAAAPFGALGSERKE